MACFNPLHATKSDGGITFVREGDLRIPCGQCLGCRVAKAREWSLRCMHEASQHRDNCFVTLTYRPEDLPKDGSLVLEHWQLFAKRLRFHAGPFRYLHCGEYGDDNFRPHYHALIFGMDFPDKVLWSGRRTYPVYMSRFLEETWGLGFCTIGALTRESAMYVAKYTLKKLSGAMKKERYRRLDPVTGEEWYVRPEYATMSRNPGIGSGWYDKYSGDVFPSDEVVSEGKKFRPPKYYFDKLEKDDPELHAALQEKRRDKVSVPAFPNFSAGDQTDDRLKVRENVLASRLKTYSKRDV
ncbi:VP4 [Gokushovirus WZ-2015a]|nr:VP4 [Gokushovirus WZ-2015a]